MNGRDIVRFRAMMGKGNSSGGGAQSDWNAAEGKHGHVLNRTHWKEEVPAVFDGDLTGFDVVPYMAGISLIKMTDAVLSVAELLGRTMTVAVLTDDGNYEDVQSVLADENVTDLAEDGMSVIHLDGDIPAFVAYDNTTFEGPILLSPPDATFRL